MNWCHARDVSRDATRAGDANRTGIGRFVFYALCLVLTFRFAADTSQPVRFSVASSRHRPATQSATAEIRLESPRPDQGQVTRMADFVAVSRDATTEFDEVILHDLPDGALVVIGSLDTSAALHTICLDVVAADTPGFSSSACMSESPHCDPANAPHDYNPVVPQGRPEHDPGSVSSIPVPEANARCRGGAPRRFSVPQFRDHGVTHEPRIAWIVLKSRRVAVYSDRSPLAAHVPEPGPDGSETGPDNPETGPAESVSRAAESAAAVRIARLLEDQVLPCVETLVGPIEDVDCDSRISVVLTELDRRTSPDTNPVRGCVRSSDFLMPFASSSGDVLYIDRRLPEAEQLTALLAPETAHAAVYSALLRHHGSRRPQEDWAESETLCDMPAWLNEAIAHVMERCLVPQSENFQRRYAAFRRAPGSCPVVAPDQQLTPENRRGGTRAAATLFVESLLADRRQLQELLDFRLPPLQRLDRISGIPFAQAYRSWSLQTAAGFLRDAESGCEADSGHSDAQGSVSEHPAQWWPRLGSGGTLQLQQYGTAVSLVQTTAPLAAIRIRADRRANIQVSLLPARDSRHQDRTQTTTACSGSRSDPAAEKSL